MNFIELLLLAIGLAMDAFAVAVCKGLSVEKATLKSMAVTGAWFGGFQAMMPALGYLLGTGFQDYIESVDHWIAFGLLALIGLSMIKEAFQKDDAKENNASFAPRIMAVLALATSIDALAVGITFAFLRVDIVMAVIVIGIVTFVISGLGVKLGNLFGAKYKKGASIAGGVILILLGTKILLEHLGMI